MAAAQPTIIATSIGFQPTGGSIWDGIPGPAYRLAMDLARVREQPRLCMLATGEGDNPAYLAARYSAFGRLGLRVSHVALFPMPNFADMREHLLTQDIIWVSGGSTANLLAVWRLHGLDAVLRECWQAGVVLMGVSAGSICWHAGGTTDSFRLPLTAVTDALGFLPYSNSPHHSSEPERRPAIHRLVAEGVLPDGYATDDGAGLVYFGTELHEAIAETADARAYSVCRGPDGRVTEEELPVRLL